MSPNNSLDACDIDHDKKVLIQQLKSALSDVLQPKHDDKFILRFLKSRDFDLVKSEKMIRENIKFKKKVGAEDLLETGYDLPELVKKHVPTKSLGFDKEGSPIRTFLAGICDVKGFAHSYMITDMMKILMYYLETDLKAAHQRSKETGIEQEQSVFILDFQDFNFRQFCDKTVINAGIQLIIMYQDHYPELLKVAYIVNAPHYFSWVLNIFKPFIHENTMSKLKICKTDEWKQEIVQHVDRSILPTNFGGSLDDPESNPKLRAVMGDGVKFPTKNYLKGGLSLKATEPGIKQVSIRERSSYDHKVDIDTPGTIIKWVFQTKDYNIRFGILFKKSSAVKSGKGSRSHPEELIAVETVDSQTVPERGELVCEKAGQYILHFDNSFSWLTGKQLLYKVEIEEPSQGNAEE